jgi:hypothetical protein
MRARGGHDYYITLFMLPLHCLLWLGEERPLPSFVN